MINLESYIPFLVSNKMTQEEFLLMFCLYRLKHCDISIRLVTLDLMKKFTAEFGIEEDGRKAMTSAKTKHSLQDKGFLLITGSGKSLNDLSLTDKATRVFCNEFTAGIEFVATYPARAVINGVSIPLKTADRLQMARLYVQRINYSAQEHLRVMSDLNTGIEDNVVNMSIENFIRSEQWLDIRKNNNGNTQSTITTENDF
jgi:hypothetical protein